MAATSKMDASRLTAHIGYWMRLVSNSVSHSFARKLETSGVTVAEWVVLREMYGSDDTTSSSQIADLTGFSRGAVSKLIGRLVDKGLVSRNESHEDRRYQDIKMTAKAATLVPKLARLADENDKEFFSCLTKRERSQILDILWKVTDAHQIKTKPIK